MMWVLNDFFFKFHMIVYIASFEFLILKNVTFDSYLTVKSFVFWHMRCCFAFISSIRETAILQVFKQWFWIFTNCQLTTVGLIALNLTALTLSLTIFSLTKVTLTTLSLSDSYEFDRFAFDSSHFNNCEFNNGYFNNFKFHAASLATFSFTIVSFCQWDNLEFGNCLHNFESVWQF